MVRTEIYRHSIDEPWTYRDLDEYQNEWAQKCLESNDGKLIFSEVSPVVTLGRRAELSDLIATEEEFENKGVLLYQTRRGGLVTYHGPGQWVVFPVRKLEAWVGDSRAIRKFVDQLLEVALQVCRIYVPKAEIQGGLQTGVWGPQGKLASIGIDIQDRVVTHGLCINGFETQTSFYGIRPCGGPPRVQYLLEEPWDEDFMNLQGQIEQAFFKVFKL
ncbi:MAG: hypothetical protein CL678_13385 [Bdellovibrionaceae bacterium]|nr:hypothetical protein [Pseudobdellovibrionaceae bacterium]